jgi:arylsulfatase A-like enzyme
VIERLNRGGFTTATVLSKEYLVGIFGKRATYRWVPDGYLPISGHVPDQVTMDATLSMISDHDPNLVFVNLGDVDRVGHSDFTAEEGARLARQAALVDTDRQVARLVHQLKSSGAWEHSMVLVLADHSMDWSAPEDFVSVGPALEADPFLAGKVAIAENGGAELLYWLGGDAQREKAVTRMRAAARSVDGVLRAHARTRRFLRLGPEAGDVVLYCRAGRRFAEDPGSNLIPGNHGHPASEPIPFFLGGGAPSVKKGIARSAKAHTMDVAPTLGAYFGIKAPRSGWEGTSRL